MTLLAVLVDTSRRVAATRSRTAKLRELAACIRQLEPDEVGVAVAYLAGEIRQARLGLGGAALREVATTAAAVESSLGVLEVDAALERIAQCRGAGANARRHEHLQRLLASATAAEQQYLMRLIVGELRQGALAGLMVEALAAAAQLELQLVRRAAMYAGSLGALAAAAINSGVLPRTSTRDPAVRLLVGLMAAAALLSPARDRGVLARMSTRPCTRRSSTSIPNDYREFTT